MYNFSALVKRLNHKQLNAGSNRPYGKFFKSNLEIIYYFLNVMTVNDNKWR